MNSKRVVICAGVFLMAGCSLFGPKKPQFIKGIQKETSSHFEYVRVGAATRPGEERQSKYYRDMYDRATDKAATRNEIIYDLMGIIDTSYRNYEMALRDDRNIKDLGSTLVAMGLTSAATVVGGTELKTILSAIATGVLGASASVDKQLFRDFATEAIINEMRAKRDEIATTVIKSMKMQSATDYPLEAGLRDMVNYYYAGTVTNALQSLVTQASIRANDQSSKRTHATEATVEQLKTEAQLVK